MIFEELVSFITPFNPDVLKGYIPLKKHTFVLVVEDEHCKKSQKAIQDYEDTILENLRSINKEIEDVED